MIERYPIQNLIENRLRQLGMRRGELARRCSFRNIAKGVRRIDGICHGDLQSQAARMVLDASPTALEIDKGAVDTAIQDTAEIIREAEPRADARRDAAWRTAFVPHAYPLGGTTRPSQITIYGMSGGAERWQKIRLDLSQPPVTFAAQAHAVARKAPCVAFHGATTGFIINYSPDRAVRFDLDANPVEHFDRVYEPGEVDVFVGKQQLAAEWPFA